jgi:hypothetical protein
MQGHSSRRNSQITLEWKHWLVCKYVSLNSKLEFDWY